MPYPEKRELGMTILMLFLATMACSFGVNTANIQAAMMARDYDGTERNASL
jgi:hypothetical protein